MRNLAATVGFVAILVGCYLVWPPLAWLVGGGLLLTGAVWGHVRNA